MQQTTNYNFNLIENSDEIDSSLTALDSNFQSLDTILNSYEQKSNKVTSLSSASTDTQYPSAKCVYDYIDTMITQALGGSY